MSSQAIGQRFMVSRGGCWQCGSDCRSQLAEVLTFSSVAYNVPHIGGRFNAANVLLYVRFAVRWLNKI